MMGVALANKKEKASRKEIMLVSLFFVFLASSPDMDYLFRYLYGLSLPIRYTHSITYVFLVGLIALVFRNFLFKEYLKHIPIWIFFLVPFSHLLLDFLVGVHANPYFSPFLEEEIVSPIGILPSSGRINLYNFYFWRNLGIELAIFIPLVFVIQKQLRAYLLAKRVLMIGLSILFVVGVVIGVGLDR
jgi:membrane-bound metal-dependent hydrolase YbcI (DUF457 family)